ncbi:MAG: permease [Chromatiales bacterium]|nr:permease [Chromatiales bacterium]
MSPELLQKIIDTMIYAFQLFAELALLFVFISFLVGALNEWLPAEKTRHYLSSRHGRGYFIGALIGSATPFCSCSTVPLTLGLLKSGAGFGPTMTLLFTSPLVNPIILSLFWFTFGIELTLLYSVMALSMAIGVSWLMDRGGFENYLKQDLITGRSTPSDTSSIQAENTCSSGNCNIPIPQPEQAQCCSSSPSEPIVVMLDADGSASASPSMPENRPLMRKAMRLAKEAVSQFNTFLPHVIIGVLIGAFAHGFVPDEWLVKYASEENLWAIPLAAIIGVPLYVRGSTMIPIAATLTAKGMGIGAVIALVIGGAGASLPEMIMLKRMFHWQILVAFLFSVFSIAITTGYMAQYLI